MRSRDRMTRLTARAVRALALAAVAVVLLPASGLAQFAGNVSYAYAYNGGGLRMAKTVGSTTTRFAWDVADGLPLLLVDGTTSYVSGLGGLPLEQISQSGTVLYYQSDQLGSTRALTDGSGNVVATSDYDSYGSPTSSSGSAVNPFGYAGQYTDTESGLQYLRARYYDASTQEFISRDPAVLLEPYSYAADSPQNATDPSGLSPVGGLLNRLGAAASAGGDWVTYIPFVGTPAALLQAYNAMRHCDFTTGAGMIAGETWRSNLHGPVNPNLGTQLGRCAVTITPD